MENREFKIEIVETLIRIVTIEAKTKDEAMDSLMRDYSNAEVVLDADDFFDVEFNVI